MILAVQIRIPGIVLLISAGLFIWLAVIVGKKVKKLHNSPPNTTIVKRLVIGIICLVVGILMICFLILLGWFIYGLGSLFWSMLTWNNRI